MNPPMTDWEIYLRIRSAWTRKNRKSQIATMKVRRGMTATASSDSRTIPRDAMSPPTRAAGAASTPKTKRGEDVIRPKSKIGAREP